MGILRLSTTGFGTPSAMCGISQFLDSKINGENPVNVGCIASEKSHQKSVHTLNAYTVGVCLTDVYKKNHKVIIKVVSTRQMLRLNYYF